MMKTRCGLCGAEMDVPSSVRCSIKILELDVLTDIIIHCKECQNVIIRQLLNDWSREQEVIK